MARPVATLYGNDLSSENASTTEAHCQHLINPVHQLHKTVQLFQSSGQLFTLVFNLPAYLSCYLRVRVQIFYMLCL